MNQHFTNIVNKAVHKRKQCPINIKLHNFYTDCLNNNISDQINFYSTLLLFLLCVVCLIRINIKQNNLLTDNLFAIKPVLVAYSWRGVRQMQTSVSLNNVPFSLNSATFCPGDLLVGRGASLSLLRTRVECTCLPFI